VTAPAKAAEPGGVQPDLILPPGFDRVGEVVRIEQERGDEPVTIEEVFAAGEEGKRTHVRRWRMTRADLVPCTACGLRGHVAGDPVRCLHGGSLRIGESPWMNGGAE